MRVPRLSRRRPSSQLGRRPGLVALVATTLLLGLGSSRLVSASAEPSPPPGTVTPAGTIPNYFWDHLAVNHPGTSPETTTATTAAFADPENHRLFEFSSSLDCPQLVALDIDTYAIKATSVHGTPSATQYACNVGPFAGKYDHAHFQFFAGTPMPPIAIDSADKLIIGVAPVRSANPEKPTLTIVALSEITLEEVGHWTLPATFSGTPIEPDTYGVSFYRPLHQLMIISGLLAGANPGPGISVSAMDLSASLAAGSGQAMITWTTNVSSCAQGVSPSLMGAPAYHSNGSLPAPPVSTGQPAVFLTCFAHPMPLTIYGQREVVRIGLKTTGCGSGIPECPDGTQLATPAPGVVNDLFFDPTSNRAFLPAESDRVTLLVYDGAHAAFEGSALLGQQGDVNATIVALDQTTGRFYSDGPAEGLTLIDGRRSPISPGSQYQGYARNELGNVFPVLPPDAVYPYTRLVVNDDVITPDGNRIQKDFAVFADTQEVTQNPPANQQDQNTYKGPIPSGAMTSQIYGGTARGYGAHYDLVNGPNGLLVDLLAKVVQPAVPFGSGHRDLLAGSVDNLTAKNGSVLGDASALNDSNRTTAYSYSQCSDTSSLTSCERPPVCSDSTVNDPTSVPNCLSDSCTTQQVSPTCPPNVTPIALPASTPTPSRPPQTAQEWPFPDATCNAPAATRDQESASVSGMYMTSYQAPSPSSTAPAQPVQAPGLGSDAAGFAQASVDCDKITANAALQQPQFQAVDLPGGMPVTIGSATMQASVTPPGSTLGSPVQSTATAVARNVRIVLPTGTIEIAAIIHTASASAAGVAGSAVARDQVTMEGVTVNGDEKLCTSTADCSTNLNKIMDQLNAQFGGQMHISRPAADDRYYHDIDPSTGKGSGSPGGYIAAVQSSLLQQDGDHLFNGMSPEEAAFLPALRIVLYSYDDGDPNVSRTVVDLAGVDVDSELGIQVSPTYSGGDFNNVSVPAVAAVAGVPPSSIYVAGDQGQPSGAGSGSGRGVIAEIIGAVDRAFSGLAWFARSPLAALQMLTFLGLLGLPLSMMRRRWTWHARSRGRTAS